MCTLDVSHTILPVPHLEWSWNTVPSPRSSCYLNWSIVWSIEDDLEDFRIFVHNSAASFLAQSHWSEAVGSLSTILLASPWSPSCSAQQASFYFLNNQRFSRPVRRTNPLLLRRHWADWREWLCEETHRLSRRHHRNVQTILLFLCFFKSPRSFALDPRNTGVSVFHWSWSYTQRRDPILRSVCTCEFRTTSFPIQAQKKTSNVRARIFLHTLQLFWNSLNTSLRFLLSPYNVVVHYMKMILPVNCSGSHCISVIMFWISARICNIMNPGNLSTRPPSAPRRICEENVPRDGYGNTRLVPVRRDAMWDFASSLTWYSVGVVDGDRKVSMEAMVKLATSMHGEMRCRGFSSSLLGLVTARHTSRGAMAQYAEIHARRNVMSDFSSSLFGLSTARQTLRPHALQSSCLESKGGDVVLLPDVSTCWQMEW